MQSQLRMLVSFCVVLLLISIFPIRPSDAEPNTVTLERLEEWCFGCIEFNDIAEIYSIVIEDATGDGAPEILAGGHNNGQSQLSVFRWYQGVLTTVFETQWAAGVVKGVAVGDFDGVPGPEVATAGHLWSGGGGELRIWLFNVASFDVVATKTWYDGQDTMPMDMVTTPPIAGKQHLIVASYRALISPANAESDLSRWTWDGTFNGLVRVHTTGYRYGIVFSISIGDTDGDGSLNVVGAGRNLGTCNPVRCIGELLLYQLDSTGFTLLCIQTRPGVGQASYFFMGVEIANIDGDSDIEVVVAGGQEYNIPYTMGELTTWVHNTGPDSLDLEATSGDIPYVFYLDVGVGQIDRDSEWESVTVGSWTTSKFSIWQHPTDSIVLDHHHEWQRTASIYTVTVGDPDLDGDVEFVTGGRHRRDWSTPNRAQLAIWNWNTAPRSDQWPMFHRSSLHDGNSPSTGPATENLLWSKTLLDSGHYYHTMDSPVVSDDRVFTRVRCPTDLVEGNFCIYAYDLDGNPLWGPVRIWNDWRRGPSSLAVGNEMVFYTGTKGNDGILGTLDIRTGARIWEISFPGEVTTLTPTIAGGLVWFATEVISSNINYVYAYDMDGEKILTFNPTPPGVTYPEKVFGSVTIWMDRAFIRSTTKLYAIPTVDPNGDRTIDNPGEILWYFDLGGFTPPIYMHERTAPVIAYTTYYNFPLVLVGGHVTPSDPPRVYAIQADAMPIDKIVDRTDPEFIWKSAQLGTEAIESTPAVSSTLAFVGVDKFITGGNYDGALYALDLQDGTTVWYEEFLEPIQMSSPALASNGVLYFTASALKSETIDGWYLNAFNTAGTLLWRSSILNSGAGNPGTAPAIAANRVFVGNGNDYKESESRPFIFCFS